jgi:hypothetical protein
VSIHVVDIHQRQHTCPAHPDGHVYDTRRTVIAVIHGGPCRTPVTIHCGAITATIPCGRAYPADRQCPACRVIVTEHTITTEDTTPGTRVAA